MILRGKCRDCKEVISWQYPLVELSTAFLFALTSIFFFQLGDPVSWVKTMMVLGIVSVSVVIFVYDLKHMEIPMMILWIGIFLVVLLSIWIDWATFTGSKNIFSLHLYSGILSGFGAFLFFFLMAAISKEKWMGLGDAYVALFMGLILGWPATLFALVVAFTSGALVGIVAILASSKTMKSKVPFAPFLLFGLFVFIFIEQIYPQWKYVLHLM